MVLLATGRMNNAELAGAKLTDQVIGHDIHALPRWRRPLLVRANVSREWANELAEALPVTSVADRMRIAQLLAKLAG